MSMLAIQGLRSGYGKIEVLHDVDIQIERGQIVTLIAINLVLGLVIPNIDIRAHVGGLVTGAAAAAALVYAPAGRLRTAYQAAGFVVISLAIVLAVVYRTTQLTG